MDDAEKYRWLIDNLGHWSVGESGTWTKQDGSIQVKQAFCAYGHWYVGYTFEEGLEMAIADRKEKA